MKLLLFILFFLSSLNSIAAQSEQRLVLNSEVNYAIIELASFNKLELKNSLNSNEFSVKFSNSGYAPPQLEEENEAVLIRVKKNEDFLAGSQRDKYRSDQPVYPNYIISVPKNTVVKLVYDKGDFEAKAFLGNLAIYFHHGIVNLCDLSGEVVVQSYSGLINCWLKNTEISAQSRNGGMSSLIEDDQLRVEETIVKGIFGSPLNKLHIQTVNAKVNLRPLADK